MAKVKKGDVVSKSKGENTGPARIRATNQVLVDTGKHSKDGLKKLVKDGKARWVTMSGKKVLIKTK